MMKWNDEIRDPNAVYDKEYRYASDRIYRTGVAKEMFLSGVSYEDVAIKKHENIRMAAFSGEFSLQDIKYTWGLECGFCFQYKVCKVCPAHCVENKLWREIRGTDTIAGFLELHEQWCKSIGVWQEDWK